MTAEALSIREAWKQIPSLGGVESEFERFTGKRMERIIATAIGLGCGVIAVQAMNAALRVMPEAGLADLVTLWAVYVPLTAMLVCCLIGRGLRVTSVTFAVVFVLVLAAWPHVVHPNETTSVEEVPWIFYLVSIGPVATIFAFPLRVQFAWAIVVPIVYGYGRLVQGNFSETFWAATAFDVSFSLMLGLVVIALAWMFRSVAAGVDDARGRAVASYADAAAAAAAEEERVAMAALMHDSVLAALIAAERAETDRAKELAVAMAREALTGLANTEAVVAQAGSDEPVALEKIVAELRRTLSELGVDAIVEEQGISASIPGRVARAVVLAARQAIGNAVSHADARGLHVVARWHDDEGLSVVVSDAGLGFDLDSVGEDRLGIRASIIARMAGVAGAAVIDSDPRGTTVSLTWAPA